MRLVKFNNAPAPKDSGSFEVHAILGGRLWPAYAWTLLLCGGVNILLLGPTLYVMQILDRVLVSRSLETLTALTLIASAGLLAYGGLEWARGRLMSRLGQWLEEQLGGEALLRGIEQQLAGSPGGAQGLRDLQLVKNFHASRAALAVFDAPWGLLFVAVLWLLHPGLGAFALASIVFLLILAAASEFLSASLQHDAENKQISWLRWCDAALSQGEIITALGMRRAVLRWSSMAAECSHAAADAAAARLEAVSAVSRTIRQITQIMIMGFSAWLTITGSLSAGGIIASSILLSRALSPFDLLIGSWRHITAMREARDRLRLALRKDKQMSRTALPSPQGRMSFQRVTVRSSPGSTRWLLQDVGFTLEPGQVLGVIGPSGAGKSTLCRVAAGLVSPDIGEVRLDGARLDMWDSDELGRHLGYLPQDVGFVPATVAETIARLDRETPPEMIHAAASAAGAHELILGLPQGYDTLLGLGGVPISGGQRQRIGLARALFGDPVFLILDEPDAHLDAAGEEALRSALIRAKARGAAVIFVTQRPGMMMVMDQTLLLHNGKVSQLGPRAEILRGVMKREQGIS